MIDDFTRSLGCEGDVSLDRVHQRFGPKNSVLLINLVKVLLMSLDVIDVKNGVLVFDRKGFTQALHQSLISVLINLLGRRIDRG